jgi:hypothetical protein
MSLEESSLPLNDNTIDYETYSMIKNTERIVLDCGGTIFGAYVAKVVLHDFNANKFFESIKDDKNEMVNFLKRNISNNIFKNIISETPEFRAIIDSTERLSNSFPEFEMKIYILKDGLDMVEGIKNICSYADFYSHCLIMDINSIYVLKKHQELYLKMTNKLFNRKYISPLNSMQILENICIQNALYLFNCYF